MTSSSEPARTRRSPWLIPTFVLLVITVLVLGVVAFYPGGIHGLADRATPPEVEGQILWTSEAGAVQLGPGGWLTHPTDDGDYAARNVRTGESWTIGDLDSQRAISQDGVVVQRDEGRVLVQREGSTESTSTADIAQAHGDKDLWPGTNSEVVAFAKDRVAVATCLAPKPARLSEEVTGSHVVIAGLDLSDASVVWTHDTGAACGPDYSSRGKPRAIPDQQYTLVAPSEDEVLALDLATGTVAQRWEGISSHDLVVQGEHVLEPTKQDTVTWSSLRTGTTIAEVTCPGARAGDPGDSSRQLGPEATPFVECWESVHALDGDRFVEIDVPPAPGGAPLEDGVEVAVGHLTLEREGEVLHLRDGLRDRAIADLEVPEEFEVGRFVPAGRLLAFVSWSDAGERNTGTYRVFDARTGAVVVTTGSGMRTGADASPDGVIVVEVDRDRGDTGLWVAATKEQS